MEEKFGVTPLPDWVAANNYGTIEKIGRENWLWLVPKDALATLQEVFYNKGLLIGVK